MIFRISMILPSLAAIGGSLAGVNLVDAGSYRWVDAEGDVHYGDSVPAEQVRTGYRVYDSYGREISGRGRQKPARLRTCAQARSQIR
ncbi:MAG: DUF4124 domain-containing protein [Gammaproteobacteria bacterium]|nr:DUF4124 domain-containing protein [Gammaproteobacteria bacterium]MBA3730851.1 DUF4124 domain-containing protein [Gammaproteobacteria bacterium]